MRVGVSPCRDSFYQVDLFLFVFRQLLPPIAPSTLGEVRAPMVNGLEVTLRF